jgi:hypothetical protein
MSDNKEQLVREIPIEWVVPDSILTSRTTHITVQQTGPEEFIVAFFEQRLPTITGSLEEQIEKFNRIEKSTAVCVARLVLDYQRLIEFSGVFRDTIDEFQQENRAKKEG